MKLIAPLLVAILFAMVSCNDAPTCIILSPEDGAYFITEDTIVINVNAEDDEGMINEIRLYIDDIGLSSLNTWPYSYTLVPNAINPGVHVIRAVVYDDKGLEGSDEISINLGTLPVVSTDSAGSVTENSAVMYGSVTVDPGVTVETGFYWSTATDVVNSGDKLAVGTASGQFSISLSGLTTDIAYYFRAYATTIYGTTVGPELAFIPRTPNSGTVMDIEGRKYKTVLIGEQWWMAENLAVTQYRDGSAITNETIDSEWAGLSNGGYCWINNDKETYGEDYGALYNSAAARSGKLCPTGWHVPSESEWQELEMFVGMSPDVVGNTGNRGTDEGGKLKETGLDHWSSPNAGATDEYGFAVRAAGAREYTGEFIFFGERGVFFAATEWIEGETTWYHMFNYNNPYIGHTSTLNNRGLSIRCLKNE